MTSLVEIGQVVLESIYIYEEFTDGQKDGRWTTGNHTRGPWALTVT